VCVGGEGFFKGLAGCFAAGAFTGSLIGSSNFGRLLELLATMVWSLLIKRLANSMQ
jgi:hypothetical protein